MSYPTDRVQLFDRDMNPLRELAPSEVFSRVRTEEVNGEHALVIVTTRRLEEGWRALTVDGTGKWREWVLTEPDESHESGKTAIGTYRFVWSLQYDLTYSYFHDTEEGVSIGMGSDTLASVAAQHVLEGVAGWSVGPCDAPDIAAGTGCVFIRESAWSKLSKLVECSGVEVDSIIEVSNLYGVTARKLCLRSHVGNEDALLRFDWSRDLTGIRRTPDPGPYYCRVVPLGKGETEYADDDETTYEYPIDITEEPDGHGGYYPYYLQDDDAALAFRIKAGDGTYVYPTIAVSYSEDDPELLLNAALAELHDYTRPGVTYEADVVQLAQAGMDVRGVALGDEVQCVDYGFNPDAGLRIQGRVLKMEVDELSPETTTQLTIGQLRDSMTTLMKDMGQSLDELQRNNEKITDQMRSMTTARYIDELLDRINAEINATGGYAYFVPGEGIITYDVAVADPLVGSEATQVVQIKGGSVRIANSKDAQFAGIDDWNWRTVFTANGINADLITTLHVIAGYIGNATNNNYWDLDNDYLTVSDGTINAGVIHGGTLLMGGANNVNGVILVLDENGNTVGSFTKDGITATGDLQIIKTLDTSVVQYRKVVSTAGFETGGYYPRVIGSTQPSYPVEQLGLVIKSDVNSGTYYGYNGTIKISPSFLAGGTGIIQTGQNLEFQIGASATNVLKLLLHTAGLSLYSEALEPTIQSGNWVFNVTNQGDVSCRNSSASKLRLTGDASTTWDSSNVVLDVNGAANIGGDATFGSGNIDVGHDATGRVYIRGSVLVANGKSRLVKTEDYSDRLLYCYETPAPMFGDMGSGKTDESGTCVVIIDDIFSETARTDTAYLVFLQKCGDGDLWVSEKKPSYFVVSGTPNLAFDWEVKAHQIGFENVRLEDDVMGYSHDTTMSGIKDGIAERDATLSEVLDGIINESVYTDEYNYVSKLEKIFDAETLVA